MMLCERRDVIDPFMMTPNNGEPCEKQWVLPPAEQFPNRPLLVREGEQHVIKIHDLPSSSSSSLSNDITDFCTPIPINTDTFVGVAYLLVAGIPGSPTVFFEERQRRLHLTVQGRFKQNISFAKVYTGQAWDENLASKPPILLETLLTPILKLLQPGMKVNLNSSHPYILSPLISTMQTVQINVPGNEPTLPNDIMSLQEDDLRVLGMETAMSTSERKKFFSVKNNLSKYEYDPQYIYTFTFYQHILDVNTLKIFGYDVLRILGKKPIQAMAIIYEPIGSEKEEMEGGIGKQCHGSSHWNWLYKIEMWHERALDL